MTYLEMIQWTNNKLENKDNMNPKERQETYKEIGKVLTYNGTKIIKYLLSGKGYFVDREILFSKITGSYTTIGKCRTMQYSIYADIFLSRHIMRKENGPAIVDILLHELIHAVLPFKEGHGELFKEAIQYVNGILGSHIKIKTNPVKADGFRVVDPIQYAYKLVCQNCGKEVRRRRRGVMYKRYKANPDSYRCGYCKGKLCLVECKGEDHE